MTRCRTRIAAIGIALVALAGCADDQGDQSAVPAATSTGSAGHSLPSQLVGQWDVDAEGVERGTVVTFSGGGESLVFQDCGAIMGSWSALRGGVFVANIYGGYGDCRLTPPALTPSWLARASTFAVVGKRRELRDADGSVVAALSPATARPKVPRGTSADVVAPPVFSDQDRQRLDDRPPAFPAGIRPAAPDEILGTWVLPGETGTGKQDWPYLTFSADLSWRGSDACNGLGGRYALADGALLTGSGIQTDVGCENINIVGRAVLAGFAGHTLVCFDADGKETRRAVHGPAPKYSATAASTAP
jgi:hypothetical protein